MTMLLSVSYFSHLQWRHDQIRFFRTDLPLLVNDMDKGVEKAATEIEVLDKKKKYLERHINEAQTGLKEVLGRQ